MNDRRWQRPPIVILTALDVEYLAVRDRIVDIRRPAPVSGTRFEVGSLPEGGDVVLARTGSGNHASAVIAERAISTFTPVAVLFVGVAGGLNPGLELGDIVVATHVYAYHGAAARPGGLKSRPRVWEIDHRIDQAAHQIAWRLARADDPRAGMPRVHFGPVASGEVLHDARVSEPQRWLRAHYDDALAIEMEAAGVAKAGQLSAAPVAVIRAISDRADGTKAGTDKQRWQARAVRNAALFATALAADLIAEHPAREDRERPAPDVHVETHGGSHGAVAGVVNGGVHNDMRRGGRGTDDGGRW
jgi:5'-methylthioadenosine/S-adenosylhomocysteine nucleosidase